MELVKKYVYKIYEERSFSAAARALFVSQPALSLAVRRLEEELSVKIFDRTTTPLSLTPEGKIYIEYLREELLLENEMKMRLKEIEGLSYGSLSVGASCYTAYQILPEILSDFSRLYPKIRIKLDMGNSSDENILYDKVERGELDLILKYDYDKTRFKATPILEERLAVAMTKEMVNDRLSPFVIEREELISKGYPEDKTFSDAEVFSDIRFLKLGEHSSTLGKMREILGEYKLSPYSVENARHTAMHYSLMSRGLGAVMLSDVHVMTSGFPEGKIKYFVPRSSLSVRKLYFLEKKNAVKNPIAEAFKSLAVDYCQRLCDRF